MMELIATLVSLISSGNCLESEADEETDLVALMRSGWVIPPDFLL